MSRTESGVGASTVRIATLLVGVAALAAAGCRQDMHDQPRIKPQAESTFFANGSGSRLAPANTVGRGTMRTDREQATGRAADDSLLAALPAVEQARFDADPRMYILRGRERFEIFCSPCHGRTGAGDGMVVRRGYKQPASFHDERLRRAPIGYFFDNMTNGFGVMPSYAAQIPIEDRWAIAAYLRTLQLSQHFDPAQLSSEERARLDAPAPAAVAASAH